MLTTYLELLICFLQIGLFSIGGGYATIPLIQEQVVNKQHWLTIQEFTDIITISQMTPGPLAVNMSTFVGIRVAHIPGAILATVSCMISGFAISIVLYRFIQKYKASRYVTRLLNGLKAISTGLIVSSTFTILSIAFLGRSTINFDLNLLNLSAVSIFAICLFVSRKRKPNPIFIMILSGVMGLLVY